MCLCLLGTHKYNSLNSFTSLALTLCSRSGFTPSQGTRNPLHTLAVAAVLQAQAEASHSAAAWDTRYQLPTFPRNLSLSQWLDFLGLWEGMIHYVAYWWILGVSAFLGLGLNWGSTRGALLNRGTQWYSGESGTPLKLSESHFVTVVEPYTNYQTHQPHKARDIPLPPTNRPFYSLKSYHFCQSQVNQSSIQKLYQSPLNPISLGDVSVTQYHFATNLILFTH